MKLYIILISCGLIAGALADHYLFPQIQLKTETKEKIVEQVRTQVVTHVVERPDGSKETTVVSTDNSTKAETKSDTLQKIVQPNYILGVTAGSRLDKLDPIYGLQGQLRVFGPVFGGIYGRTDGEFGVLVSLEF